MNVNAYNSNLLLFGILIINVNISNKYISQTQSIVIKQNAI